MFTYRMAYLLLTTIIVFGLFQCGLFDDDSNSETHGESIKTKFSQWTKFTSAIFHGSAGGGILSADIMIGLLSENSKTINSIAYDCFKVGIGVNSVKDLALESVKGTTIWGSVNDGLTNITVAAIKDNNFISTIVASPDLNGVELILETPVTLATKPALNQPQRVLATGSIVSPRTSITKTCSLDVTYTLDNENASVDTKYGNLSGCSHFSTSGKLSGTFIPKLVRIFTQNIPGEAWYHSVYGLVAYTVPSLGISVGLSEQTNFENVKEGFNTIQKTAVIDSSNKIFLLSTYDRANKLDADKDKHAQMLLEIRWLDSTMAKTQTQPDRLLYPTDFKTVFGTFSHQFQMSSSSIFHPEENGLGYYYWFAYVNQAAKNEAQNGIAYQIQISNEHGTFKPVKVSARIGYYIVQ